MGILFPNSIDFALAYFAVLRAGAIAVIMDVRLKAPELRSIFLDAGIKALIGHQRFSEEVQLATTSTELLQFGFGSGSLIEDPLLAVSEGGPRVPDSSPEVSEADEALYLYTSGTTGKPKGVVLTYQNLDCFPRNMHEIFGHNEKTVAGLILPMSHISGPIYLNEMVARGSRVVIFDQVKPSVILEGIERHRVTYLHAVPTIYQLLLSDPDIARYDTRSLGLEIGRAHV